MPPIEFLSRHFIFMDIMRVFKAVGIRGHYDLAKHLMDFLVLPDILAKLHEFDSMDDVKTMAAMELTVINWDLLTEHYAANPSAGTSWAGRLSAYVHALSVCLWRHKKRPDLAFTQIAALILEKTAGFSVPDRLREELEDIVEQDLEDSDDEEPLGAMLYRQQYRQAVAPSDDDESRDESSDDDSDDDSE